VPEDERTTVVGVPDELGDLGRRVEVAILGNHADQVGIGRRFQPRIDEHVVDPTLDPAGARGGDDEVEDGVVVLGVVGLGPDLAHGTQAEGLHTVLDDDRDLVHGARLPQPWQEINLKWHCCHWWQQ
jgi:hypothetical protein